ncbi:MAG TPA: hypothetical protein VNL37_02305 [Candidatus Polarisedimenticolia bacterium]|nr:hypothetical protein [Candidatus Polarisedimenticolia bacterium]
MHRATRFLVRGLGVGVVLAALSVVSGLSPRPASPYASALAGVSTVQAASPNCEYRYCPKESGRKTPSCHRSTAPYNCQNLSGGGCAVTAC